MNTIKRIHINPQSKGSLGKSFEAEFRTAWLDYHGIQWNADLLVPSGQMPEVEPPSEPAAKPSRTKQPMLNLGE